MSIRIRHNVLLQISKDTDGKDKRYYPETKEVVIDSFEKLSHKNFTVDAVSSETMDLSDIGDVRGLYLEVDADCDVSLNGSLTPLELRKASAATGTTAKLFFEGLVTSLEITNAGASALHGELVLWGDIA